MGFGAGTFSDFNAKIDAQFISYIEVIEMLGESSDDSCSQIVLSLKRLRIHENSAVLKCGTEGSLVLDDGVWISALLDATCCPNARKNQG